MTVSRSVASYSASRARRGRFCENHQRLDERVRVLNLAARLAVDLPAALIAVRVVKHPTDPYYGDRPSRAPEMIFRSSLERIFWDEIYSGLPTSSITTPVAAGAVLALPRRFASCKIVLSSALSCSPALGPLDFFRNDPVWFVLRSVPTGPRHTAHQTVSAPPAEAVWVSLFRRELQPASQPARPGRSSTRRNSRVRAWPRLPAQAGRWFGCATCRCYRKRPGSRARR
jgi:hypothetical protein